MAFECIQVRSNGLLLFPQPSGMKFERFNLQQAKIQTYDGTMTQHARKRLGCAIDVLIQRNPKRRIENTVTKNMMDFQLNFITLTVPNHRYITASQGYERLLGKWVRYMRDKYGFQEYIWKTELTQNGQPHWHITSNTFIPWPVIRWKWNSLMKQERLLDRYAKKNGNFNPNSVDVHKVESIVDMQKYLSKEFGKSQFHSVLNGDPVKDVRWDKEDKIFRGYMYEEANPDFLCPVSWTPELECIDFHNKWYKLVEAKVDGKVWDCSEVLKRGRFTDVMDRETATLIYTAKHQGQIELRVTDYCTIIETMYPHKLLSPQMQADCRHHIRN